MSVYATNRRANFEYEIKDKFDAGLALLGHEVKAVRAGKVNLTGSYAIVKGNEVFLVGAEIAPYQPQNVPESYDPSRTRRLLLTHNEIKELIGKTHEKGLTLVPTKIYSKGRTVKIELGIGKRKKKIDKRETIKNRETKREIDRSLKN